MIAAEKLFFDVRPALNASDWIMIHVISPEIEVGSPDFAAKLKVAYFGGPNVARAVLEAGTQLPVTVASAEGHFPLRDEVMQKVADLLDRDRVG